MFQVLLHDIKAHGSLVKSLVKQYELQALETHSLESNSSPHSNDCSPTTVALTSPTASLTESSFVPSTEGQTTQQQTTDGFKLDLSEISAQDTPSPRDYAQTPRSVETNATTPRETTETYSTEPSTPRDPLLLSSRDLKTKAHKSKVGKGGKSRVPKKAKALETRYYQAFLKAIEFQIYLEPIIADYKVRL